MPRLKVVAPEAATGEVKEIYQAVKSRWGVIPNLIQGFGTSPVILKAYTALDSIISEGRLSEAEREIVRLVVSEVNHCSYCVAAHTQAGKAAGLSNAELVAVREGSPSDSKHAALVSFVRQVVEKKGFVSDRQIEDFRQAGYDDEHIGEVITIIGQKTISNFFNHVHETEVDFPAAPELSEKTH